MGEISAGDAGDVLAISSEKEVNKNKLKNTVQIL